VIIGWSPLNDPNEVWSLGRGKVEVQGWHRRIREIYIEKLWASKSVKISLLPGARACLIIFIQFNKVVIHEIIYRITGATVNYSPWWWRGRFDPVLLQISYVVPLSNGQFDCGRSGITGFDSQ